jgi:hypothetical protein
MLRTRVNRDLKKRVQNLEEKVNLLTKILDLQVQYNLHNNTLHTKALENDPNSIPTNMLVLIEDLRGWASQ